LWLAPFIVHPGSRLAADHPGWLLRGRWGRPVNAGFLWGTFATALDLTHPDAVQHTKDVIHTAVEDWGFPYLKLDFLSAAALPGRFTDPTRTRAQVLRAALEAARQAAGEQTVLLGCGCPLGPAIGLVDAMRISADTSQRWRPAYQGIETFFNKGAGG
jgi:alpha-galactosidase